MQKNKIVGVSAHGFFYKFGFRLVALLGVCLTAFFIISATSIDSINNARELLNGITFWINALKAIFLCVFAIFWNVIARYLGDHFEFFRCNLEYILSSRWVVIGWASVIYLLLDLRVVNYLL